MQPLPKGGPAKMGRLPRPPKVVGPLPCISGFLMCGAHRCKSQGSNSQSKAWPVSKHGMASQNARETLWQTPWQDEEFLRFVHNQVPCLKGRCIVGSVLCRCTHTLAFSGMDGVFLPLYNYTLLRLGSLPRCLPAIAGVDPGSLLKGARTQKSSL